MEIKVAFDLNGKSLLGKVRIICGFLLGLAILSGVLLAPYNCYAGRVYIDITSPYLKKIPIAIPYLSSPSGSFEDRIMGKRLSIMMSRDLTFQGYFSVLNPDSYGGSASTDWSKFRVDYVITGKLVRNGNALTVDLRLFSLSSGQQLVGRRYIGKVEDLRLIAHKFCDLTVRAITGQPGISLSRIAMVVSKKQKKYVYVCDFDGQELLKETSSGAIVVTPKISPDGRWLAYTSYKSGRPCIYIENIISHTTKLLCSYKGLNIAPSWSPDGRKLVVTLSKGGNSDLYLVNLHGKIIKRLTYGPGINVSGTWSPDGTKIAFVSNREGSPQIYIMDLKTGFIRRLTYIGNYNTDPSWSPMGDEIAYTGLIDSRFEIFTIPVTGGNPHQLTETGDNQSPSWSPDGRQIVFSSRRGGAKSALYVMYSNGSHVRLLLRVKGASVTSPDWGPDRR